MVSLVLLLKNPRPLNGPAVAGAVGRAFGMSFGSDPRSNRYVVPHERPNQYLIGFREHRLAVTAGDAFYWDDPDFSSALIGDPRARAAVDQHRAWIAVDSVWL